MPLDIDFGELFKLGKEDKKTLEKGALSEDVWVQFICSTENGYDPESEPDDRVRPSHAAFHGKVFRMQDAPVPPLDYGCRCAIRYVAAPDTPATKLVRVADDEPTTTTEATEDWLKDNVDVYDTLKRAAAAASKNDMLSVVTIKAKELGVEDPRSIATMVVDVVLGKRND